MLTLFSAKPHTILPQSRPIMVVTPLGDVRFDAILSGQALSETERNCYEIQSDAYIHRWENGSFEVEFALVRPKLPGYLEGRVNDSWAGIWRVKADEELSACTFSCRREPGFTWKDGGPNSGEHLDAQSFWDDQVEVTIGTEDSELIGIRADMNELMPQRLKPEDPYNFAEYVSDGFTISIPNLLPGEVCQFQYLVAWAHDSHDAGPWLAVERNYKDILNSLGIV